MASLARSCLSLAAVTRAGLLSAGLILRRPRDSVALALPHGPLQSCSSTVLETVPGVHWTTHVLLLTCEGWVGVQTAGAGCCDPWGVAGRRGPCPPRITVVLSAVRFWTWDAAQIGDRVSCPACPSQSQRTNEVLTYDAFNWMRPQGGRGRGAGPGPCRLCADVEHAGWWRFSAAEAPLRGATP